MANVIFKHTEIAVANASNFFAKQARIELSAKRPRTAIRANWKKVGNQWQPIGVKKQRVRANYVASGSLVKSIQATPINTTIAIEMNWYAERVIEGRKPFPGAKDRGGKGIPLRQMKDWTRIKSIRPRNPETGEYLKVNNNTRNAMRYLMNRKIKFFGTQPFDFVQIAQDSMLYKWENKIIDAIAKDLEDYDNR